MGKRKGHAFKDCASQSDNAARDATPSTTPNNPKSIGRTADSDPVALSTAAFLSRAGYAFPDPREKDKRLCRGKPAITCRARTAG